MSPIAKNILKFLIFFIITVLLFWLVYRDQNPSELFKVLREDVNYFWVIVAIILGMLSNVSRAIRWQLVIRPMGYNISFMNSFMGVMIGYFLNQVIPRAGEFSRCGVVSKYESVPFSNLLGTVFLERMIDALMLLLLTFVVIITQFGQVSLFLNRNSAITGKLQGFFTSERVWFAGAAVVVLVALSILIYKKGRLSGKIHKFISGLKNGILAIKSLPEKGLFIVHTIFIWLMYYLMLYLCFFCFDFTSGLGPMVGLTVFVLSSYGMLAPVQGGIGAYHFMVLAALMLYLPYSLETESMVKAFALLTHGTMMLIYIIVGVLCMLYMPIYNRRR